MCTGESGQCPVDVYKKNGSPCGATNIEKASGKLKKRKQKKIMKIFMSITIYAIITAVQII